MYSYIDIHYRDELGMQRNIIIATKTKTQNLALQKLIDQNYLASSLSKTRMGLLDFSTNKNYNYKNCNFLLKLSFDRDLSQA